MGSIGFGLERLALPVIAHPRLAFVLVLVVSLAAALGVPHMRFTDDAAALFRADSKTYNTYAAFQERFVDGADTALLLVTGDLTRDDHWAALEDLTVHLKADPAIAGVTSIFALQETETAAGPSDTDLFDTFPDFDADGHPIDAPEPEAVTPPPPLTRAELARHPLNDGLLLTRDLTAAAVILRPDPDRDILDAVAALRGAVERTTARAPPGLETALTGLPIVRTQIVDKMRYEQPLLLAGGLSVGFLLGVLLLGRVSDAVVVAVMPVLSILWIYGVFGWFGIAMTTLINNLPLLVLALAFANSVHLVYAARRDLHAQAYHFSALRQTLLHVGPAVALSTLTTMLAFLTFWLSGSEAIIEFGMIGAGGVFGVLIAALVLHPVTIWAALQLGWRPVPPMRGQWWLAKALEGVSSWIGRVIDTRGWVEAVSAGAVTLATAYAFLQVAPGFSVFDEVPQGSPTYDVIDRLDRDFGGAQSLHLPLPIRLDRDTPDPTVLTDLRRAHEAAEAAFPDQPVTSLWTVLRWLEQTDRFLTPARLERVLDASPESLRHTLMSRDEVTPALMVRVTTAEDAAMTAMAGRLEAAVGTALEQDLSGTATGFAVLAARSGPQIITRLSLSLAAAAFGAAALAALAFRSVRVFWVMLLPNVLPVLMIGALLYGAGLPLQMASVLAMTIALGIAVDDTVHMANCFWAHCEVRVPRIAIVRTMREVGPVLIATTLVLTLGLAPALWSWSPGISVFAGFAIATIGIALLTDVIALPALLSLAARLGPLRGQARRREGGHASQ